VAQCSARAHNSTSTERCCEVSYPLSLLVHGRLQALVERGGLVKLPPALDEAVAAFLGSSRRFFWPAPQSISAAVRTAFERPVRALRVAQETEDMRLSSRTPN